MSRLFRRAQDLLNFLYEATGNKIIFSPSRFNVFRRPLRYLPATAPAIPVTAFLIPVEIKAKTNVKEKDTTLFHKSLQEADALFNNKEYKKCLDCLDSLDAEYQKDIEVLWRRSRALFKLASQDNMDKKTKCKLAIEAFNAVTRAMETNENHCEVHKWMSAIIDLKSSCESLSERVKNVINVKKHMMRAAEINPRDGEALYMLGQWCFNMTDLPWYQRKIVQALFASPPTSTFDEALQYFSKAEEAEPRFSGMNLLMLGKTYMKLGNLERAKYYLNLAFNFPAKTSEDREANTEAEYLLKSF